MKIFTPATSSDFAARNILLQKSLREPGLNFPIESEYPIVLGDHGRQFSFCFQEGAELIAHANLWPRVAVCKITKQKWNIGLIGNVATDERFRGRGIMSAVLNKLKSAAVDNNLAMLVLWSDLLEFYQKQGFRSFGEEIRYIFAENSFGNLRAAGRNFVKLTNSEVNDDTLRAFLRLRPGTTPTIDRSMAEFRAMLSIPLLELYCSTDKEGRLLSWAVMGKGADMQSVVHEWGGSSGDEVLQLLRFLLSDSSREAVMLLTPSELPEDYHPDFSRFAAAREVHPMALVWTNDKCTSSLDSLASLFIWGLDSI